VTGFIGLSAAKALRFTLIVAAAASLATPSVHADDSLTVDQVRKALRPVPATAIELERTEQRPDSRPTIDLEIAFEYNSARISATSIPVLQALGNALSNPVLKGSTFIVAGYADGIGSEAFNQDLSERRANSVKQYLVEKFGIAGADLIAIGFGKNKLKNPDDPADPLNRRVQILNMETKTNSK
jgi:outer membrane protein OmpA-like peptidoglycan-associated protein